MAAAIRPVAATAQWADWRRVRRSTLLVRGAESRRAVTTMIAAWRTAATTPKVVYDRATRHDAHLNISRPPGGTPGWNPETCDPDGHPPPAAGANTQEAAPAADRYG
ncbi:hypothetical protein [Actinoplanes nipponensis]|uniref:hypothetical protein n=1 Tax=Actinoplanes nipponensis TaxID=135950 RepID=UPI0031E97C16